MSIAKGETDAIITTDMNLHDYFNQINFPDYNLHFSKENLVRLSGIFYYSNDSLVLRRKFDRRIRHLQYYGLIEHYQRMFRGTKREIDTKEARILRLARVSPIFRICGVLLILSFLVFLLELYAYKFPMIRDIMEYLTY